MAIKKLSSVKRKKETIDLAGPMGNAFYLLGRAKNLAERLGKDGKAISDKMKSSDYENLIKVFDDEFGEYVDLLR